MHKIIRNLESPSNSLEMTKLYITITIRNLRVLLFFHCKFVTKNIKFIDVKFQI